MTVIDIAIAAAAGSAGAVAAATLASRTRLARTAVTLAGAAGGLVAAALVASTVAAQRPLPLALTARSAAIDGGTLQASCIVTGGAQMAQFETSNIRSIALVGHGAAGKTTLAEALLVAAGALPAAGSVERGTTVSDGDPLEKTWQHSLRSSVMHLESAGTRIHLVDTPGYPDFVGQSIAALDGVEMITSRMMAWSAARKLCRLVGIDLVDDDQPAQLA